MNTASEKTFNSSDPAFRFLMEKIAVGAKDASISGLHGACRSLVLSMIAATLKRTVVYIGTTREETDTVFRDLSFFLGEGRVLFFPAWDERCPDDASLEERETALGRARTLAMLLAGGPAVIVGHLDAFMQRTAPLSVVGDYIETVSAGTTCQREKLEAKLHAGGFHRVSLVEEKGEYSVRGHIVDVFPPVREKPVRMEFDGDDIVSIREFDSSTQRSAGEISGVLLSPAGELVRDEGATVRTLAGVRKRLSELDIPKARRDRIIDLVEKEDETLAGVQMLPLFYGYGGEGEGLDTFFEYLPSTALVACEDVRVLDRSCGLREEKSALFTSNALAEGKFHIETRHFMSSKDEFANRLGGFQALSMDAIERSDSFILKTEKPLGLKQVPSRLDRESSPLAPVVERMKTWLAGKNLVVFLSVEGEVERMARLFEGYGLPVTVAKEFSLRELERAGVVPRLLITAGSVSEGFYYPGLGLVLVSEEEIFGKKIKRPRKAKVREGYFLKSFGELKNGDFVVHLDHGIGIYHELKRLSVGDMENDFLLIEYEGGDKLYVPVDRLNKIQRYIGPEDYMPPVDRLGGSSWETVKKRVTKSVREIAEELVAIYAARGVMEGHRYAAPDRYYEEFASYFEFEETPDQARAIEEVDLDLGNPRPMDRLVCGDAGFGKTEVALRASFRVAMEGKQVAFLVPTTILAEQHYRTFVKRFAHHPVRIEALNRYRPSSLQKKIVGDIARGAVDIVIGTHRLLQKDVAFKDLGLVIIDEEQRFGVSHKEKLKKLRTLVDVLTLTATPIPRTLQLSLVGIRDLSIINTPPPDRQSIRVHVHEFSEEIICEAIRSELKRGGQVFFVHDRVRSIEGMARLVEHLVPEAKIGVAHGRMKAADLERVMVRFIQRDYDVLVCTTIIGSGVDIPTANTIVINRADRFGLAQLYQLRGRVGRSNEDAAAYLLVPRGAVLSQDAKKRLRVIQDYAEPGSGFKIAAHDLELRGAGNLLGVSQSGHVSAVGYELYTELMEKAVSELRGEGAPADDISPEIRFRVPAFIPDDYIADMHSRLITYKEISAAAADAEIDEIRDTLRDRYGFVPPSLENLMEIIGIRNRLKSILAEAMEYDGRQFQVAFRKTSPVDPAKIVKLSRTAYRGLTLSPDLKLSVPLPGLTGTDILGRARELLMALA
ncbi:MAG: transcription-repair coupling factor [Deltaproteobacteria bacterium]|nr:transcription-repair coupling factor [Deltaproteobacteria bacterium]